MGFETFLEQNTTDLESSSENVSGTNLPQWVSDAGRATFEEAVTLAGEPYSPYPGARQATFDFIDGPQYDSDGTEIKSTLTADEQNAAKMLREGTDSYESFYDKAGGIADTLGGGYDSMSSSELLGDDFVGMSSDEIMGNYQGATREELLGNYQGASRADLLGDPYSGATREELFGDYKGASRADLLGDPFSLESAQPYMDIYQGAMDPAVREIEEQTIRAQNEARARASTGGGGFGSRLGLLEATTAGEGARAAGDLRAGAAREGLDFASGRYDTDRAARASTEDRLRGQFLEDRTARRGIDDTMYGRYVDDRSARGAAEDTLRNRFLEDRSARGAAENTMYDQFGSERAARIAANDIAYTQYGDERDARFAADNQLRTGYESDELSKINQMTAYQNQGANIMAMQDQVAQGLITVGEAQRILEQQGLDIAHAGFLDEKGYDRENINFALGALNSTPYNVQNKSYTLGKTQAQAPSVYGQAIGAIGTLGAGIAANQ
tara:strand:- start:8 stop:1498 length:1491 start_codon:yes stop_codon:yes gene_type:complete